MLVYLFAIQFLALLLTAAYVVYVRMELLTRLQKLEGTRRDLAKAEQLLRRKMLDLERDLQDLRERPVPEPSPPPPVVNTYLPPTVLTLQKRSQALKMLRKGEAPDTIARSLSVPQNQIQLLVRVQELID